MLPLLTGYENDAGSHFLLVQHEQDSDDIESIHVEYLKGRVFALFILVYLIINNLPTTCYQHIAQFVLSNKVLDLQNFPAAFWIHWHKYACHTKSKFTCFSTEA